MKRLSRLLLMMFGSALALGASDGWADPRPRVRRVRNRFERTVLVGASAGVGSPYGFAGAFVELRPWRAASLSVGGGVGGGFGPSVGAMLNLNPLGGTTWALGVEAGLSHQFTYGRDLALPDGRTMPAGSDWFSGGVVFEGRPSRFLMFRVGAGYTTMLNTGDFGIVRANELAYAESFYDALPGVTPLDAARAALAGDTLGTWYFHIDIAPSWRW
jgi:hypothetical protein